MKYGAEAELYVYKRVLEQIKPKLSLEANIMKLRLSCFRHTIRRQDSLVKTTMLGRVRGRRKRRTPNTRWTDSKATGLSSQELSRTVEYRTILSALTSLV